MRPVLRSFFFSVIFIATISHAQFEHFYENWRWAHFTTKTGLPSNYIEEIVETGDSTVWVSTYNGIAWYNGYRWIPVAINNNDSEQRIRKIEPFYGDKLLVIASGSLFVGNKNGFSKVPLSPFQDNGVVSSVCAMDSTSFLCIYEVSDSTYLLKVKNNIVNKEQSPPPGKLFKAESSVWLLGEGKDGDKEIFLLHDNSWIQLKSTINRTNAIRDIVENKNGFGLFAVDAPKQNIGLWQYGADKRLHYSVTERNQPIRTMDISDNNDVIVVYESGEIHILQNKSWHNLHPLPKQMLNIVTVRYRGNNDLWIGTETGLYLFKRHHNIWESNHSSFSDLKNVVMEVYQSHSGDVWVGTMNGVDIVTPKGLHRSIESIDGAPIGLVTGINEDKDNHIWISAGSGFKGVYEWDGKKWKHHLINASNINIHKIRKDLKGDLWFLALGVNPWDPSGYILSRKTWTRIDSVHSLPSNRLYAFSESRSGTKWFGTSSGLTRIKGGMTTNWGRESLGRNYKVYTLTVDNAETVWFSTFSPQLGIVAANDSVSWVWTDDELYNYKQKVWDLSFDLAGVLWVATTRGLYRYYNSTWSNYSHETGMYVRELRVVLPAPDKIYIGGHGIGLRTIVRKQIGSPIRTFISKPIVESNDLYCTWDPLSYWGSIPSEQIETRYRLGSSSWSEWNTQSSIAVKNLSSGDYMLQVQAKDSYGNIYNAENIASFTVEPPIYMRPFYMLPFVLMLMSIGAFIVRYKKAQQHHKILIQKQRTRIANDLHDEVGSNLGSISLISQRIARNETVPPDVREDLEIIRSASQETSELLRDIVWYVNPRYDNFMSLEARLREIVGRMLRHLVVNIEMTDDIRHDEKFIESRRNIILMFKEILHNIMKHSGATSVNIRCERKPESFLLAIKDNGVGFVYDETLYGNGLQSLKRRAEEVGAELKIDSEISEGTEISIIFKTHVTTI